MFKVAPMILYFSATGNTEFIAKELAKKLNIAESNISNWKNGDNLPSLQVLYELCKILDESADYLLGLTD
jgi:transcriptional regulator with XRE-family HTH domain